MGKKNNPDAYKAWFLVIASLLVIWGGFKKGTDSTSITSVGQISVILSADMENVTGPRGRIDYKFWTKEHKAEFVILKGSISRGRHSVVSALKKGQKIQVNIKKSDVSRLGSNQNRIKVYGLAVKGKSLFTVKESTKNRKDYANRIQIFLFLIGGVGLLKGIVWIRKVKK